MCVPGGLLIRKPTRLLVSHDDMRGLGLKCPGACHPKHEKHLPIAGSFPGVGSVSKHADKYPSAFVKAVLRTVKELPTTDVLVLHHDDTSECLAAARVEEQSDEDDKKLMSSLKRLPPKFGPCSK